MFKVFAFGFETCIKTISPLISRLINEALLVAYHNSIRCCISSSPRDAMQARPMLSCGK